MITVFKELSGSPVEEWGAGGMRAKRQFLVAWDERVQFVNEVAGTGAIGGNGPLTYPGSPSVIPVGAKSRPFGKDLVQKAMTDLSEDLNEYLNFALIDVNYQYAAYSWPGAELIELQEHTYLTYRATGGAEAFVHKTANWSWDPSGSPDATDDQAFFTQRIPIIDHHLTWHNVGQIPTAAIRGNVGKVNASLYKGFFEPETLLFDTYEINQDFIVLDDGTTPAPRQSITYLFRERQVQVPQAGVPQFPFLIKGWNFVYRTDKGNRGWAKLYDENGDTPYPTTDNFDDLFQYSQVSE